MVFSRHPRQPGERVRHTWRPLRHGYGCLCLLALTRATAGEALPDLDARDIRTPAASPARTEARVRAQEALVERLPRVQVDWEPRLGAPQWIATSGGFLTGPDGEGGAVTKALRARPPNEDPHRAVKSFVDEHSGLFGHDSAALGRARVTRDFTDAHNGLRTTVWQQEHAGLEVFEAVFKSHITRNHELVNVSSRFLPQWAEASQKAGERPAPLLSVRQAILLAAQDLGQEQAAEDALAPAAEPAGAEQRQEFRSGFTRGPVHARLVWLPLDGSTLQLCWSVALSVRARPEVYRLLLDARTGQVLLRRCQTEDISNASYRVFTGDSPTPLSPGYAAPGNATQPPAVARTLVTLSAANTNASPNGWINDGVNETRGNNVDASTDLDDDNALDLPRPQGSPSRVFDFPLSLAQEPSQYAKAAVVNLFYWCNWAHDKLYELGFHEAAGNFQVSNFGKGGLGGDAVRAEAQDGGGTKNANFNYADASDGGQCWIQMYLWPDPAPARDGDLDTHVVLHEYVHGLSTRLVGGGVGLQGTQPRGMGEGWSDFFALSLLSKAAQPLNGNYPVGAYSTKDYKAGPNAAPFADNYYFGIRRYPYSTDLTVNPLTFRDMDPAQASLHAGIPISPRFSQWSPSQVHSVGEIWCSMLWEARANLVAKHGFATGNGLILQLVMDGMKLAPANPTFVQARDAILQADQVLTAGANKNELWAAFAKRGLGVEAIAPASNTTLGVVENYSPPDTLMVKPLTVVTVSGPFGGPFNWTNKSYTLSNASAAPLTWSATAASPLQVSSGGGSLAPSATTTLIVSLNAATATSLPIGEFDRMVVISNHTSQLTRQRTFTWKVTEPLVLEPANSYANAELLYGPQGGPFTAYFGLLRLTNRSNLPMPWQYPAVPEFSLSPSSGTLAGHGFVDLTLSGGLAAPFLPLGNYTNLLAISNLTTTMVQTRKAEIRVKNDQYLTQNFGTGFDEDFDLAQTQLTFLPDGSPAGYAVCRGTAAAFPVDPAGGTGVLHDNLGYDDFTQITLSGGKKVSLFGFATNKVFINFNGSLTFTEGDEHYQPTHFDLLRVSPLLADYYPSATDDLGGVISWKQLTDRLVVTWQNLYNHYFPHPSTNNFQVEMFFDGAIRFTILTGTGQRATVGLSRGVYTNSSPDFINTDFSARPACDALLLPLVVTGPASATEGVPFPAGAGRVIVQPAPPTPLVVSLVSSDPTEITIPSSVTVPAGSTSAVFNITVQNDALLDGTKVAVIKASAPFREPGSLAIPVHDNETTTLQLSLPAAVTEGGPSVLGTVSTGSPVDDDVVVQLSSPTRPAQATLPFMAFAVIPAGQTSATFSVFAVDDTRIDGTQPATFVATVANWGSASDTLNVLDNESTNLSVLGPLFISEGVGADLSNAAQVRLSGTLPTNLTVHLSGLGGAPFEYLVSGPVTIPAGQTNAAVDLSIADDSVIESTETFQITASAPGFVSGSWTMFVLDNDGPPPPLAPQPPHLAADVSLETGLSWAKSEGELLVNGGFEDSTLAGWTRIDSGGGGWVSASSSYNPPGTDTAQPPLTGLRCALSMQYGNGRHELHQDVVIPEGLSSVTLSWSQRLRNHAAQWDTNQQFRVELRDTANQVLTNLYVSQPGQPLLSDWTQRTFNLFPWRGETLRLAFVEVDELGALNVSLDNVSIQATPSAPTTWQVYFGTDPSPDTTEFQGTTTNTAWALTTLATNATYYWQVRSVRAGSTNTGPVWQFVTTDTTNAPPVLSLRNPGSFSQFTNPAAISFSIGSIRDDGPVSKVEFWADGVQLGQDFLSPYGLTWSNAALGEHVVWAVAQDSLGARGTSVVQRISVVPAAGVFKMLVPFGSDWSYHDAGGNLGTSWRSNSYRLSTAWKTGPGQLGYGDGDEATVLDYGDDPLGKPITTYFRKTFTTPSGLQLLQLRVLRDDGVAVYLNGNEVLRNNLTAGANYLSLASAEVTAANETLLLTTNVSAANVVTRGGNLLAAEVHQSAASSVDLSFDLELAGVLNLPPLVSLATPASASVFVAPAQVPLGASASDPYGIVTNVQFLADGAVVGSDNTPPFSFVWSNAPVGPHTLRASATDNSGATNTSAAVTILVVGPQAQLQVAIGPNGTLLTWPIASAGYRVESTASLDAPAAWESVPGTPAVQGSLLQLIVPAGPEPRRFFRLVAP